jgi:hypothetical protein
MATATYADLAGLPANTDYQARLNIAITHYAQYIIANFASFTPKKINWAVETVNNPDRWVPQISRVVAQDSIFTSQNTGLSSATMLQAVADNNFQAAVETALNTTVLA